MIFLCYNIFIADKQQMYSYCFFNELFQDLEDHKVYCKHLIVLSPLARKSLPKTFFAKLKRSFCLNAYFLIFFWLVSRFSIEAFLII